MMQHIHCTGQASLPFLEWPPSHACLKPSTRTFTWPWEAAVYKGVRPSLVVAAVLAPAASSLSATCSTGRSLPILRDAAETLGPLHNQSHCCLIVFIGGYHWSISTAHFNVAALGCSMQRRPTPLA